MMQISVYNQAVTPLGLDLGALVSAMQTYADEFVGPAWGVAAQLVQTGGPVPDTISFILMDDADSPGALAYHSVDDGLPIAKVFVRTTLNAGESLSVSASHELAEMLCDASCSQTATNAAGIPVALEVADAVEESSFKVQGFDMSDFCLRAYFDPKGASPFDHCGVIASPFALALGGYASLMQNGQWVNVFGSEEKKARFALEDRRGHRSEYRRQRTANA